MSDLFVSRGATFSPCNRYRYLLSIWWNDTKPKINYLMLNPSTADEFANDPTVERCERRAREMGYGGLIVTNVYALRSTDPKGLYDADDPVGPENDVIIGMAAAECVKTVCGWGAHARKVKPGRVDQVLRILQSENRPPHALALNKDGSPRHPLYVGYDRKPVLMEVA